MFWQMVTIEQTKLFKRWILWVELGLMALAAILATVGLYAILQVESGAEETAQLRALVTWPDGLFSSLSFAAGSNLGGILIVILAGAVTAQEYGWRTLQLWLSRGVPRPLLLAARFVALLPAVLLITLTPLLAGGLATAVFSQTMDGRIPFGQVEWVRLAWQSVGVAYTLLPYAGLAFMLAVLSRSTVVAIGGGLAYALLIEGIAIQLLSFAGGGWARVGQYLPAGLARSLLQTQSGLTVQVNGESAGVLFTDGTTAALGLALYTLVFLTLAILTFRKQDLGG